MNLNKVDIRGSSESHKGDADRLSHRILLGKSAVFSPLPYNLVPLFHSVSSYEGIDALESIPIISSRFALDY